MTYQECLDKLKEYKDLWGKTVESNGELFKVKHTLICPVDETQFGLFVDSYLTKGKSAETSLSPFINQDLRIVLKAYYLSDSSVALLEIPEVRIIS